MKFGNELISLKYSIQEEFKFIGGNYLKITKVVLGKFLMERPDNGKIVIELSSGLIQTTKEDVLPFSKNTLKMIFKEIEDKYIREEKENEYKKHQLCEEREEKEAKIQELESLISKVKEKNVENVYKNLIKSQMEMTKALRRNVRKLKNINEKINEVEKEAELIQLRKKHSLDIVEFELNELHS